MNKILIVEDEPQIRQILKDLLSQQGYEIIEAGDGKTGFEQFLQNIGQVQLIITDIAMPMMTGVELEKRIHALLPEIKMIALTGSVDVHEERNYLEDRFDKVIQKPFDFKSLVSSITNTLDGN
ncbi:MAG: response regulator [Candidatus Marinimicrobia bacterium]|nr:response regulator [Candidatus Neomarinimicrobiota bacterium]